MSVRRVLDPFARAFRLVVSIPSRLLVGLGVLALIGTLVMSAWLSDKDLAVAVAVSGTFLGTAFLTLFLPRLVGGTVLRSRSAEEEVAQSSLPARDHEQRRQQAEAKLQEAERQIARLESMRINVDLLRPILNLGLLEVETTVTDFQHHVIGKEELENRWRTGYRQAYMGVVQIPVKAHLGVNLQNVRIRELGDRLIVSGLAMTNVTDTAQGAKWLLDEIRTEYLKGRTVVKFKGDGQDQRAKTFSREQELQVRSRLQQGQDFRVFEAGLIRMAEQILRVLLAPMGKEILFVGSPEPGSLELLRFLTEHNHQLSQQIADLKPE
jgi:hypothetical protein